MRSVKTVYSKKIYDSWRKAQFEKYAEIHERIGKYLSKDFCVLDIGIGKAWFEEFLKRKGIIFKRIVGVDADLEMVEPRKKGIEYIITEDFNTLEKFDLVVCIDAVHLLKKPEKLTGFSKKYLLVSIPLKFKEKLVLFEKEKIIEAGSIGKKEKDWFLFIKV